MTAEILDLRKKIAWLLCAVLCFFSVLTEGYAPVSMHSTGKVDFIDVGQGDSILVQTPSGKNILIDGGGTLHFYKPTEQWKEKRNPYEIGKDVLVPLLESRGIHQIDDVIISHDDADHIGGLYAVLQHIPVKHIWFNGFMKESEDSQRIFQYATGHSIPLLETTGIHKIPLGPHTFIRTFLPFGNKTDSTVYFNNIQNNDSLVFVLQMYDTRFLLTGDMELPEEAEVLSMLKNERITVHPVDILKVAHHGSKSSTSTAWLDVWKPKVAVISVGENNRYGHPSPQVLQRLNGYQVKTYRTDQNGEVQVTVNQDGYRLHTVLHPS